MNQGSGVDHMNPPCFNGFQWYRHTVVTLGQSHVDGAHHDLYVYVYIMAPPNQLLGITKWLLSAFRNYGLLLYHTCTVLMSLLHMRTVEPRGISNPKDACAIDDLYLCNYSPVRYNMQGSVVARFCCS